MITALLMYNQNAGGGHARSLSWSPCWLKGRTESFASTPLLRHTVLSLELWGLLWCGNSRLIRSRMNSHSSVSTNLKVWSSNLFKKATGFCLNTPCSPTLRCVRERMSHVASKVSLHKKVFGTLLIRLVSGSAASRRKSCFSVFFVKKVKKVTTAYYNSCLKTWMGEKSQIEAPVRSKESDGQKSASEF